MPDLQFEIESAGVASNAAAPQLMFKVRITNSEPQPIQSIALRVKVQIEAARRRYTTAEQEHLKELFGEPEQWSCSRCCGRTRTLPSRASKEAQQWICRSRAHSTSMWR